MKLNLRPIILDLLRHETHTTVLGLHGLVEFGHVAIVEDGLDGCAEGGVGQGLDEEAFVVEAVVYAFLELGVALG